MLVFHTPLSLLHDPPYEILSGCAQPYLESPDRIALILSSLLKEGREDPAMRVEERRCDWSRSDIASDTALFEAVARVHDREYLNFLREIYEEWVAEGGSKDAALPESFLRRDLLLEPDLPDTTSKGSAIARIGRHSFDLSAPVTAETWIAALASTKVALEALDSLRSNGPGAFALCRPPGHHATDALCGGYCFLNSVAVAARAFQHQPANAGAKVAILDIDYHHGNGTSKIFYNDPTVLYVSLHATPDYPYWTGGANERGGPAARGSNINYPLPLGTGAEKYLETLSAAMQDVSRFEPDLLLVSLGVDTYKDDPITQFQITKSAYAQMGELIAGAKKPTLFCMEGGYYKEAIGTCVRGVLAGFQSAAGR